MDEQKTLDPFYKYLNLFKSVSSQRKNKTKANKQKPLTALFPAIPISFCSNFSSPSYVLTFNPQTLFS